MTIVNPVRLGTTFNPLNPQTTPFILSLGGDLTVETGASIYVSGQGHPLGIGPGAGWTAVGTGAGGGHGGDGGNSAQGAAGGGTYGSKLQPIDLGSGGGYPAGGSGGGSMQISVGGTLTLEGSLYANGFSGTGNGGGGSAGSIFVEAAELAGYGWVYANGGSGAGQGGGGGGGRVSFQTGNCDSFELAHAEAKGGSGYYSGTAGSVHFGTLVPATGDIHLSSSDSAWAYPVTLSSLTMQLITLNNAPPVFSAGTWTPVTWRHADLHVEKDIRFEPYGAVDYSGSVGAAVVPSSVEPGSSEGSTMVYAFPEKVDWVLTQDVTVDFIAPGTYSDMGSLTGGTVPTGTRVDSHFLHFDTVSLQQVILEGSITFDSDIIGVIATSTNLDASDSELGAVSCLYPVAVPERGMELDLTDDYLVLDTDQRTLHFHGRVQDYLDQVRIITRVPDPQSEAYVSTYDFTSGVDEVTLNNTTSAWYRFTFELPPGYSDPVLFGKALLDDQGTVFLNGNQVSGDMTISGFDPDPANGPDGAYYALTDTGKDLTDLFDRRIMTAPSPDPFCTSESSYFVEGTNELIFGVCADASYWYPTGLEFEAIVNFATPAPLAGR